MFIITVLPIARGLGKENLSYFSKEEIAAGAIVSVPVRKKTISGIVLSCEKAENLKAELKSLPFIVKKIEVSRGENFFKEYFMKAAADAAEYFATTTGSILASLVPKTFFEKSEAFSESIKDAPKKIETMRTFEELAIQNEKLDRFDTYKSIIRESLAKKESIFVCLPTEEAAVNLLEKLHKGIEEYTHLFTNGLSDKKMREAAEKIQNAHHALLVVGTVAYLPFIREDTKTIIIEEESSRYYKIRQRPYLDMRDVIRFFAKAFKAKLIYADDLLRVETYHRVQEGLVSEYSRIMKKRKKTVATLIVDMKKEESEEKKFQVLSDELSEMIRYALTHKKSMFVFAARRGLSSQTVCRDCGETVLCENCSAPVTLHKQKDKGNEQNNFICHHCGTLRSAHETCTHCGSWRLEAFGIGIEKIVEEIENLSEKSNKDIRRLDADTCPTPKEAKKVAEEFRDKGGILIGTEMALQYLEEESTDYSSIAAFDSLFSLPDFRIEERIMHIILSVKAIARDNFLIQGRNVKNPVVEFGTSGDLSNFAKNDLAQRKSFDYPPFQTLIKLTIMGDKDKAWREAENLSELLEEHNPSIFPAFIKTVKGKSLVHMLIKLDPKKWPDKDLRHILLSLPPSVAVRVDPESLL